MAERTLAILVTARDLASKTLRGVNKEAGKLGRIAGRGAGTAAKNLGKLAIAGAGVALVLGGGAVKAAGDFEAQLNTINTVAQRTPAQLDAIGQGIRQIARDSGTPLEDLTAGFYDLVSAGVAADQAQRVLASSNRLAIGGLGTAAEGVDLLTTALNSYGVAAKDQGAQSERFADIFAKSIEKGKVTAAELASSFATVGPIAAKSGIEIEELAAGYATLTAQGVPAAEAATQMRSALVGLLSPNAKLNAIQTKTGVNFAKLAKEKGLVPALERLRVEAKKAEVPLIDVLGRVEGFNFAISATGANLVAYNANLADMGDSAGTAARQMSERQQGLNFELSRLKALARDAGITIGSKLLPKLTPLAERLVAFLEANQSGIEKFGDEIAGAFDKAAAFAERIPWEEVGSGLKTAAVWSGKLMDVFMGLPPQVQGTIVALAGLNKLSGGAVSGIVGELGKGLIKGVLGMNAGVVNIKAGVVNGGGGRDSGGGGGGWNPLAIAGAIVSGLTLAAQWKGAVQEPQLITQTNQNQSNAEAMVTGGASTADLQKALAGANDGLRQLTNGGWAQPIADALYGGQIDATKQTIATIQGELNKRGLADQRAGERSPTGRGRLSPDERDELSRAISSGVSSGITAGITHSGLFKEAAKIRGASPLKSGAFLRAQTKAGTVDKADVTVAGAMVLALKNKLGVKETTAQDAADLKSAQHQLTTLAGLQKSAKGDLKTAFGMLIADLKVAIATQPAIMVPAPIVTVNVGITARATAEARVTQKRASRGRVMT